MEAEAITISATASETEREAAIRARCMSFVEELDARRKNRRANTLWWKYCFLHCVTTGLADLVWEQLSEVAPTWMSHRTYRFFRFMAAAIAPVFLYAIAVWWKGTREWRMSVKARRAVMEGCGWEKNIEVEVFDLCTLFVREEVADEVFGDALERLIDMRARHCATWRLVAAVGNAVAWAFWHDLRYKESPRTRGASK